MGKKSKGGGGTAVTTSKTEPWAGQAPYLNQLYDRANQYVSSPWNRQFYAGRTNADLTGEQQQGLNLARTRALVGSDLTRGGKAMLHSTISGNYLGQNNPYLKGMFTAASRGVTDEFKNAIMPSLASQFSMAGRTGSGAHVAAAQAQMGKLGETLGDMGSNIYGRAYESERGRMMDAAQMVPAFNELDYADAEKLFGIGQFYQDFNQSNIDADRERFEYYRDQPANDLQLFNQMLQGGSSFSSQTGTQTMPSQRRNPFAGAAGGGLMGAALGLSNPLIGLAALGGGLGLFG